MQQQAQGAGQSFSAQKPFKRLETVDLWQEI
jgi:hypothetical protein